MNLIHTSDFRLNKLLAIVLFLNGGCIFTIHTSFMLKNKVNNVISIVTTIIIVVVIIIPALHGGGA